MLKKTVARDVESEPCLYLRKSAMEIAARCLKSNDYLIVIKSDLKMHPKFPLICFA